MPTNGGKMVAVPGTFKPHLTQVEMLASDAVGKVVMAGRRWGKTRSAVAQTLMWIQEASVDAPHDEAGNDMTKTLLPPVHVWVVGPTYPQLKQIMEEFVWMIPEWQIVNQYQAVVKGTRQYELRMRMRYKNGQRPAGCVRPDVLIEFKSADNYEALQTVGLDVLYITESQDVRDEALDKVLPTLTTPYRLRRAIFEGIPPDSENHWFSRYWEAANRGRMPGWEAFKYKTTDNYHIGPKGFKQIAGYRDRMTDEAWRRMYFAKQPKGSGAFFRQVNEAAVLNEDDYRGPEVGHRYVAGLDIGRRNSESVLVVKDSKTRDSVFAEAFGDTDWEMQLHRFEQICHDWRVDIVHFDGTSCGGDLMDFMLNKLGLPALAFQFTQKAKAELYQRYAVALERGLTRFPKEWTMLIKQLQAVRNVSTKMPKFESDGGVLDDWVDAESLALWVCEDDIVDLQDPLFGDPVDRSNVLPTVFINDDGRAMGEYKAERLHRQIFDKLNAPSYEMLKHAEELAGDF